MAVTDRRDILIAGLAAAGIVALPALPLRAALRPLRVLILGGTSFIGPHMVDAALARGHAVTLFNRGRTNAHLFPRARFPKVEKLRGDRDGKLDSLRNRKWDVVIDNSGYLPRLVRDTAMLLQGAVPHYVFTSTISVYADFRGTRITEADRVGRLANPAIERITGRTYGPLKAYCEDEVRRSYAERASIVRPGFIVGPGDTTDRWTYWPVRFAQGGEMLAPGSPADPVQFIDVRDLAAWYVRLAEQQAYGTFNATGPASPLTMSEMFAAIAAATERKTRSVWVDAAFLRSQGATLPVWRPPHGPSAALHRVANQKALTAGLKTRPVVQTVTDTLKWWNAQSEPRRLAMRAGLRARPLLPPGPAPLDSVMAEEAALIKRWRARRSQR
ncbi:MAG TPA: epimerase [Alphaproteobacteria bacterium]|nr:epimerase [Alphaproteobacteria bacterium]